MKHPKALALLLMPVIGSAILWSQPIRAPYVGDPVDDPSYDRAPDVPGLPRVLLIGDSISMGYTPVVRERLKGIANVHRPFANCSSSDFGLAHIDQWLGAGPWDVIHFNFGLHDLKYVDAKGDVVPSDKGRQRSSLADYEKNLRALVGRLRQTRAKLIFATSTPVPSGVIGRNEGDERRYNRVALRVMTENGIAIDDLWAFVRTRQADIQLPHNVHYNQAGWEQLGDAVAASIRSALAERIVPETR